MVDPTASGSAWGRLASAVLFAVALVCVGLWACDRVGWEGDDLALLSGIAYLDELGRHGVYRYAWQPLTYEVLHAMRSVGLTGFRVAVAGTLAGMAGVTLLIIL